MTPEIFPPKAIIVTGAAQGIGRAIALRLAEDGYDIAVNDLAHQAAALDSLAEEIKSKGKKAIAIIADVSDEEDVQKMVDRTVKELGELWAVCIQLICTWPSGVISWNILDGGKRRDSWYSQRDRK